MGATAIPVAGRARFRLQIAQLRSSRWILVCLWGAVAFGIVTVSQAEPNQRE
jgi:hypothetical protein